MAQMVESSRTGLMGLSIVARLQQSSFVPSYYASYAAFFRGRHLIMYRERSGKSKKEPLTEAQLIALSGEKFKGALSHRTIKKMTDIIQNWIDTNEYYNYTRDKRKSKHDRVMIMITLTLSAKQHHTDQYIKRVLLNRFLIELLRKEPLTKYMWKAESQKNGNIHFHILTDQYFPKEWILQLWNKIQRDSGYLPWDDEAQDWKKAPSTRIEALRDKIDGTSYAAKYISKNEGARLINGRLWGCSTELRALKKMIIPISKEEVAELIAENLKIDTNLYVDEFACIVKNIYNYERVKAAMIQKHTCVQMVLESNIDTLNLRPLCPEFSIYDTEWFHEVQKEASGINISYMYENGLLFD